METAVGLAFLAAIAALQAANARNAARPVRIRAHVDTFLHGLAATAALAPLIFSPGGIRPDLAAVSFAAGFGLDLDHPLFFRSLSLEVCSSRPTRPPLHSLAGALAAAGIAAAVSGSLLPAWAAGSAVFSHALFDCTDSSGTPLLFPWRKIVRNLPLPLYLSWAVAAYASSAAASRLL